MKLIRFGEMGGKSRGVLLRMERGWMFPDLFGL